MSDLRARLVPVVATGMLACGYAEGDDVSNEVRDLIDAVLAEVAAWFDERAHAYQDAARRWRGSGNARAALMDVQEAVGLSHAARLLREANDG